VATGHARKVIHSVQTTRYKTNLLDSAAMQPHLPILVLVPGSWLGPDFYQGLAQSLRDYHVELVDQPSTYMSPGSRDLHEDMEHTRTVIEKQIETGQDVVLVGHSAGGHIATLAAEGLAKVSSGPRCGKPGIIGYIGFATIYPEPGLTIPDMNSKYWPQVPPPTAPNQTLEEYTAEYRVSDVRQPQTQSWLVQGHITTDQCVRMERHFSLSTHIGCSTTIF
jgi:pimeloyl-ACP methyl ester carboxylesterase